MYQTSTCTWTPVQHLKPQLTCKIHPNPTRPRARSHLLQEEGLLPAGDSFLPARADGPTMRFKRLHISSALNFAWLCFAHFRPKGFLPLPLGERVQLSSSQWATAPRPAPLSLVPTHLQRPYEGRGPGLPAVQTHLRRLAWVCHASIRLRASTAWQRRADCSHHGSLQRSRLRVRAPAAAAARSEVTTLPLEFVRHRKPGASELESDFRVSLARCRVVAACRSPDAAEQLQQLREEHPDTLTTIPLDVTDEQSIEVGRL